VAPGAPPAPPAPHYAAQAQVTMQPKGTCPKCGKGVYDDQKRRQEHGVYFHADPKDCSPAPAAGPGPAAGAAPAPADLETHAPQTSGPVPGSGGGQPHGSNAGKQVQQVTKSPQTPPAPHSAAPQTTSHPTDKKTVSTVQVDTLIRKLAEMGFTDVAKNSSLLQQCNYDLGRTLHQLVETDDQASTAVMQTVATPTSTCLSVPQEPSEQQQQHMLTRLSDIAAEPLCVLNPIVGIGDTVRQPILDAAIGTGVADMDVFGWVAGEVGSTVSQGDPHGLDKDEAAAIALYTTESNLYPTLNSHLRNRNRELLKPFFAYLRLLLDARRKLPLYVGTVWRGVQGVDLREKYPKGSEIYWWAFSSTTKELSTLQNPQFFGTSGKRTIFNIQLRRGSDIARYSMFQGQESEAEVLIFPGTKFRVVDSLDTGGDIFMVHLEEVVLPFDLFR